MEERAYPDRLKVLYIGGTGRTGSTILTRLLGEIDGWFPGGELAFLWRYGLGANGSCSCGVPLRSCDVWGRVVEDVAAKGVPVEPERMVELRKRCWSVHLPLMLASPGLASRMMDRLEEFPEVVAQTYRSLATLTSSHVIVDSSKEPHYSWILRDRSGLDVYYLHLVRDPRAVAHSWSRRRQEKGLSPGNEMERRAPWKASLYFDVSNGASEAIWRRHSERYRILRYEDILDDPAATVAAIARFVDSPLPSNPITHNGFTARDQHVAWGNPNRFDTGRVELRPDDAWRRKQSMRAAVVSWLATAPFASRYGYPARRSQPRHPLSRSLQPHQLLESR